MKEEIKEILDDLRNKDGYVNNETILTFDEAHLLLDYITNLQDTLIDKQECINVYDEIIKHRDKEITNLQEENEILKENAIHNDKVVDKARWNEMIYKSKIDKALDILQYIIDYGFDYDGLNTVESLKGLIDMLVDYAIQTKDILKGEDD